MNLKIVDVPQEDWHGAISVANQFLKDYPDRKTGFHSFVVYLWWDTSYIVYKTKTQLVVRKS